MKPFAVVVSICLLSSGLALTSSAQTYTVSSNNQSWSSLVSGGSCTNCTINIPAGWTLLLNSSGTCKGCTFNGGTVKITSGFNFNDALTTFNNDTVLINTSTTFWNVTFQNDSVAVNASLNSQNNTATLSHVRMAVKASANFNAVVMTNDSIHIANTTFHSNNTPANFTSCFVEVSGNSGVITTPGSTITNSNFIFSNNSSMTLDNSMVSDGSSFTMHDGSLIKSNGATDIKNGSSIIMDGTSNSFTASNALPVSNSTIKMNSGSTLKGSSLTVTGSTITATGGTITSDNALSLTGSTLTARGTSIKGSSVTIQTGSTMNLSGGANLKSDNAITVTASNLTADSTTIKGSSFTAQTGSTLNMSGTSNLTSDNAIDIKASNASFSGNAWARANDKIIIENGSSVVVGDGPIAGTAHLITNNSLQVLDSSQLKITNGNNYLFTSADNFTGGSSSYTIKPNTISCGTGHPNACASGYVYGCATMNGSGAVACVILALSAPELTTRLSGGQVSLSWQTPETSNVEVFLVQRSANGYDWTVVGEVTASTFQSSYSLKDPGAQTGTNYYRLQQVDKDGHSSWSAISTVKLTASAGEISLYPNPVRGKTFFLKTPSTDAVILKIYTLSGQQLLISSLKGQTQYTVQLPVSLVSNTYLLVQVITNGHTQAFTVLEQ